MAKGKGKGGCNKEAVRIILWMSWMLNMVNLAEHLPRAVIPQSYVLLVFLT
jgi:hypothetical protein